jgi:hypothetical protein
MDKLIKQIQHEIDSIMGSKYAKFSDRQIEAFEISVKAGRLWGHKQQKRKIEQYTLDGILVMVHDSMCEAARSVNRSTKSVREAIQGKSKTCGGFIWKYEN